MTTVGHTLVGAAIGTVCLPRDSRGIKKVLHLLTFIVLANLPDLPVPMWGHNRYDISHSIFTNLIVIGVLILLVCLWSAIFHTRLNRWILLCCGIAIFSHILLDSFYNHGLGIPIFWPFSDKSLVLPIPWLSVQGEMPPPVTLEMVRIWLYEFVTFCPVLLIAVWIRKLSSPRSSV
jgi:membrane-bound metal-dependent hydrolase YbcI (DUF457 family)